jgi:hypothetical protein
MDYAQVEDGAFATTPILTTTASATRAVDAATIANNICKNAVNNQAGAIFMSGASVPTNTGNRVVTYSDGTYYRGFSLDFGISGVVRFNYSATLNVGALASTGEQLTANVLTPFSMAGGWYQGSATFSFNNKVARGNGASASIENGNNLSFSFGAVQPSGFGNSLGYIKRLVITNKFQPETGVLEMTKLNQ